MWGKRTPRARTFQLRAHLESCSTCQWAWSHDEPESLCGNGRQIAVRAVPHLTGSDPDAVDAAGRRNLARIPPPGRA
jgi:hypothetical protein